MSTNIGLWLCKWTLRLCHAVGQYCSTNADIQSSKMFSGRSLIERQKERLGRLVAALAQEKARLASLNRETNILAAPPPPHHHAQRLRAYVTELRDQCDTLSKRLELSSGTFFNAYLFNVCVSVLKNIRQLINFSCFVIASRSGNVCKTKLTK